MPLNTGDRLCRIMDEKGVSVRELSRRTNLSISSIRRLRKGHLVGNLHTWVEVMNALDASIDDMLKGDRDGE